MAYVDKALRFNPASPVFQENLHDVYHHMRNHQPVTRIGKTWVLTRYQDVYQAMKERAFGKRRLSTVWSRIQDPVT